ncbi:tumor necrosis factor receptor superfamily member 18 isoform X1 [Phyllostomus discolor]|uniref:Tumor necrosis factor receptor superfamily member 18 isoform X1 n=1 Tax=Phyllostomus discolor TaxID=89673 RepID=A0A6J2LN34_9CHIR|nr:tumor necrosis factor receptor superfamily member 18 isoform X1 [Phyllostomus discolor]
MAPLSGTLLPSGPPALGTSTGLAFSATPPHPGPITAPSPCAPGGPPLSPGPWPPGPPKAASPTDACPGQGTLGRWLLWGPVLRTLRPLSRGRVRGSTPTSSPAACPSVFPSLCLSAGEYNYGFICIDCAEGTFSGGSEGRCDPWADCSRSGLRTLFPGNRTHDAVCELPPPPPPAEPRCPLTALLVLGACILAVVAAQLALQLWQLRRQLVQPPETQPLLEAPPVVEDTYSCQFPEEERGGRLSEDPGEDKGPPGNLWV